MVVDRRLGKLTLVMRDFSSKSWLGSAKHQTSDSCDARASQSTKKGCVIRRVGCRSTPLTEEAQPSGTVRGAKTLPQALCGSCPSPLVS